MRRARSAGELGTRCCAALCVALGACRRVQVRCGGCGGCGTGRRSAPQGSSAIRRRGGCAGTCVACAMPVHVLHCAAPHRAALCYFALLGASEPLRQRRQALVTSAQGRCEACCHSRVSMWWRGAPLSLPRRTAGTFDGRVRWSVAHRELHCSVPGTPATGQGRERDKTQPISTGVQSKRGAQRSDTAWRTHCAVGCSGGTRRHGTRCVMGPRGAATYAERYVVGAARRAAAHVVWCSARRTARANTPRALPRKRHVARVMGSGNAASRRRRRVGPPS